MNVSGKISCTSGPLSHECGSWTSLRFDRDAAQVWESPPGEAPVLVIVTRGRISLSAARAGRCSLSKGRMALVPSGRRFRWRLSGRARVLLCRLDVKIGCCQLCTPERIIPAMCPWGGLVSFAYGEDIAMVADLTEISIRTDMTQTKPHVFEEYAKELLTLLYRQFGVEECLPRFPWQEKLDAMIELRMQVSRRWGEAILSSPVALKPIPMEPIPLEPVCSTI